jgi:hypothetical protein
MASKTRPIIEDFGGLIGIGTQNVPIARLQIGGHIYPDVPMTYSLGSPTAQWSSSYVFQRSGTHASILNITASNVSASRVVNFALTTSLAQFTTASNPPYAEGLVFYDWSKHTLTVYNDNNQLTHNLGQKNLEKVYNPSAGAIPAGMPVYISASNAQGFPQVVPAIATGLAISASTANVAGVTDGYISASSYGYICTVGVVHYLTQSWAAGTTLWLSPFVSGTYVNSPPTGFFEKFLIGVIIQSGSTLGTDLLVLPNEHSYGATSASYAYSGSRSEFAGLAFSLAPTASYQVFYVSASAASITGSFCGYLSGSATTASYVPTCSIALLAYTSQTSDFALDSMFAYSSSYASTCSVFITNYQTASVYSSSYASGSTTASYVAYGRSIVLCAAYTPVLSGPDAAEYVIPYSPIDGATPMSWSIKRMTFRAQTTETSQSIVNIERSTGPGTFNPVIIGSITLASANEATTGSIATGASASFTSGDKVRFNVVNIGTAQNWTIITEISNA